MTYVDALARMIVTEAFLAQHRKKQKDIVTDEKGRKYIVKAKGERLYLPKNLQSI